MIYLEQFTIPNEKEEDIISHEQACNYWQKGYTENRYPCEVFSDRGLHSLDFSTVTILYGGNGSGKSTLLNLIAEKMHLNRLAPFNKSAIYNYYLEFCDYKLACDEYTDELLEIPKNSRIITSDDVFDYMLNIRVNNDNIEKSVKEARDYKEKLAFKETIKMKSMEDYERVKEQLEARRLSGRKYVQKYVGEGVRPKSNGETALRFFDSRIENDILCLLDEPENSMSPKFQIELVKNIEEMAKYCGCQFVIATHSPFLLAIENAKIYNLDTTPITLAKWWELENPKIYFEFFNKHKDLFLKEND
ncbi:MAG: ATP-binding cassette domain-containing protein [Clostridiales bacterium]|nr:ATP-binding cassette domain-containing protein [Clostridiales bacterium]